MKTTPLPHEEDPLDATLRADRREIADDGFTERVLAGLPERPVPILRVWNSRAAILLGAALAGGLLFAWLGLPELAAALKSTAPSGALLTSLLALATAVAAVGGALLDLVEET